MVASPSLARALVLALFGLAACGVQEHALMLTPCEDDLDCEALDPALRCRDGYCGAPEETDSDSDSDSDSGTTATATAGSTTALDCQGLSACADECVQLEADPAHCGACFNACASDQVCFGGACEAACGEGSSPCEGACVNLHSDPANCGFCDRACPPPEAHGVASCELGNCGLDCEDYYAPDREVAPTRCEPCSVDALLSPAPRYLWRFDEPGGAALVEDITDVVGSYHEVTLQQTGATDPEDHAAGFTAEDAHALVTLDDFPDEAITVELLVKFEDLAPQEPSMFSLAADDEFANEFLLIYRRSDSPTPGLDVLIENNVAATGVTLPMGVWVHLAVSWTSYGKLRVYVNGERERTIVNYAVGASLDPGTLVFGQDQDLLGGGFDPNQRLGGSLDVVAVYDRALDNLEIAAHARAVFCAE